MAEEDSSSPSHVRKRATERAFGVVQQTTTMPTGPGKPWLADTYYDPSQDVEYGMRMRKVLLEDRAAAAAAASTAVPPSTSKTAPPPQLKEAQSSCSFKPDEEIAAVAASIAKQTAQEEDGMYSSTPGAGVNVKSRKSSFIGLNESWHKRKADRDSEGYHSNTPATKTTTATAMTPAQNNPAPSKTSSATAAASGGSPMNDSSTNFGQMVIDEIMNAANAAATGMGVVPNNTRRQGGDHPNHPNQNQANEGGTSAFRIQSEGSVFDNWIDLTSSQVWGPNSPRRLSMNSTGMSSAGTNVSPSRRLASPSDQLLPLPIPVHTGGARASDTNESAMQPHEMIMPPSSDNTNNNMNVTSNDNDGKENAISVAGKQSFDSNLTAAQYWKKLQDLDAMDERKNKNQHSPQRGDKATTTRTANTMEAPHTHTIVGGMEKVKSNNIHRSISGDTGVTPIHANRSTHRRGSMTGTPQPTPPRERRKLVQLSGEFDNSPSLSSKRGSTHSVRSIRRPGMKSHNHLGSVHDPPDEYPSARPSLNKDKQLAELERRLTMKTMNRGSTHTTATASTPTTPTTRKRASTTDVLSIKKRQQQQEEFLDESLADESSGANTPYSRRFHMRASTGTIYTGSSLNSEHHDELDELVASKSGMMKRPPPINRKASVSPLTVPGDMDNSNPDVFEGDDSITREDFRRSVEIEIDHEQMAKDKKKKGSSSPPHPDKSDASPRKKNRGMRVSFEAPEGDVKAAAKYVTKKLAADDDDDDDSIFLMGNEHANNRYHRDRRDRDNASSIRGDDSTMHGEDSFYNEMGSVEGTEHGDRASVASRGSMASMASRSPRNNKSLNKSTKRFAKNIARQPGRLVKTVARQPGKLARGTTRRLRRKKRNNEPAVVDMDDIGDLTQEEYDLIGGTLKKNFIFHEKFEGALHALILAFERVEVDQGHVLIRQGEDDEQFIYIVAEGECSNAVDGVEIPGPYGTYGPRSIFGELGVLYNTHHKSATVSAKTQSVVLFRSSANAFFSALSLMPDGDDGKDDVNMKDIDKAIDQLSGTKSLHGGEIMRQYQPNRLWLWSQWHGTILEQNLLPTVVSMLVSVLVVFLIRFFGEPTWSIGHVPDENHQIIQHLSMVNGVWIYTMTLTTFILTFYVNQAFLFWQSTNSLVRQIQGNMSDFMLSVATHADRNEDGSYTSEAGAIIDDIAQSARIFHALFWASCARRFYSLATPVGMASMAQRGMMTPKQLKILQSLDTPYGTKHVACLEWMMISASQGIEEGHFRNSYALSRQLLDITCQLRSVSVQVTDSLKSGRPPLSYTHLVQILIDSFIWSSPIALYAELGVYSVPCVGMITLFYGGLLNMAKIFLDPLGNQHFTKSSVNMGIDLGVLTRESNAGTSLFKEHGAIVPF